MKEFLTSQSRETENQTLDANVEMALEAALDKKARDVVVIDLDGICSFSDCFIICSGTSTRQTQSIADGVEEKLREAGLRPSHIEGQLQGEWILLDYLDFVVHIFTETSREFYDLERLWHAGKRRGCRNLCGTGDTTGLYIPSRFVPIQPIL